jgi:hypothetical protein
MATPKTLQRVQTLIWVLIYGGLLTLVLGVATARTDGVLGWTLGAAGGIAAAVGVVLIFVRAWMKPDAGG